MKHANATILIVEDDAAVRQTLSDILELNGFRPIVAANGIEGLEAAKCEAPALILTDVSMPGMTGFELLETFRADPDLRSIPVIIISAKVDRAATRQGMELGAADFITKPFTESEVIHSVATRLDQKELLDELDAFAHTVAHDLKNPLCALNGRIILAQMTLDEGNTDELRRHLAEATVASERLSAIIDELLLLSGVRRQHVPLRTLDMTAIVDEALERAASTLQQHPATLHRPEGWPVAVGHAPWVVHIWVNYITNAAKYAGPNADITLGSQRSADETRVRYWVEDHGPGLDAAGCAKMFVPFTRISTVRATGHGLGLSIVRRIAEKLGGGVGVESTPGRGSRFWFELPASTQARFSS
ncbi:HAMP domain-containing sensor histidine kinase [Opitutus sp. ER46]|uniref:hybrid sensor histidine kinase/response regulator n=1 Tax=Opitutus sp. ER46 TaxID=2161864 RepID=UPI000D31F0E3|nr:HAMP domain-containing sensor histidine kinase [Opitutus sp. ER46]PTX92358.1 hybrid sensor histidine kinase/response regulator [Opitutus sp. ER46]